MNYFAHATLVLPMGRPPLTAGSILPDLIRYAGARRTHRPAPWNGTDAGPQHGEPLADLADGIRSHLEADAAFHTSTSFVSLMQGLMTFTRREVPLLADHWTRWLLPHVAAELVLDRLLVRADPAGAEACYEAIRWLHDSDVLPTVCAGYGVDVPVTRAVLAQWVSNRRLHSYDTFDGLAFAVERSLGMFGRPVFAPGERAAFETLVERAEVLMGDPHRLLPTVKRRRR